MPVVDPDVFSQEGTMSNEGQSFVLQLDNNWKEWIKEGSKSGARRNVGDGRLGMGLAMGVVLLAVVV